MQMPAGSASPNPQASPQQMHNMPWYADAGDFTCTESQASPQQMHNMPGMQMPRLHLHRIRKRSPHRMDMNMPMPAASPSSELLIRTASTLRRWATGHEFSE